jgi:hypothetical protein
VHLNRVIKKFAKDIAGHPGEKITEGLDEVMELTSPENKYPATQRSCGLVKAKRIDYET